MAEDLSLKQRFLLWLEQRRQLAQAPARYHLTLQGEGHTQRLVEGPEVSGTTEAQVRQEMARIPGPDYAEPTRAEQQAYEDRPYDLLEDRAHGWSQPLAELHAKMHAMTDGLQNEAQALKHKQGMHH
jgi:hypothetical protein